MALDTPAERNIRVKIILGQQFDDNLQIYYATRKMDDAAFVKKIEGSCSSTDVMRYRKALMAWGDQADSMIMDGVGGKSPDATRAFIKATQTMNDAFNNVYQGLETGWLAKVELDTGNKVATQTLKGIGILAEPFYTNPRNGATQSFLTFLDPRVPQTEIDNAKANAFVQFTRKSGAAVNNTPRGLDLAATLRQDREFYDIRFQPYFQAMGQLSHDTGSVLIAGAKNSAGLLPTVRQALDDVTNAQAAGQGWIQDKYPNGQAPLPPSTVPERHAAIGNRPTKFAAAPRIGCTG